MYARHISVVVFSLSLVINVVSTVGVVYDPLTNNMYCSIKGEGAYINGGKINVNDVKLGDVKSVSNFDVWLKVEYDISNAIKAFTNKTCFVSLGSAVRARMCVATGDSTFAIFPCTEHKNCDIAAAKIIVEEVGGKVTDLFMMKLLK